MAHSFVYLANHLVFFHNSLAMLLIYYKDFKTQKNIQFGSFGWSDAAYGCSKSKVHTAAAEAGGLSWYVSSSAALES